MKEVAIRAAKFYAVGALGIGVQLAALSCYKPLLDPHYLWATALAVETAVLHNFLWHEFWTWSDRRSDGRERLARLWRFHISNGLLSLAGNLLLMRLLVGVIGLHYLLANLISIAALAVANFVLSELYVFRYLLRRPGA
ncbi:MAG: GtrA family protein [Bryobacterales bacterium]|nr:GtrA family protein [Bryobacterales bacterium]